MRIKLSRHGSPPDDEHDASDEDPTVSARADEPSGPSELDMPDDPDAAIEQRPQGPTEPGGDQPPPVQPVIVPRWVQLVVLPILLLGAWALARASGNVLLILVTASVIAIMLNPIVKVLERARIRRGFAIFLVYLGFFAILAGIGALLSNTISTQISRFQKDVPHLVDQANKELTSVQNWLNRNGIKVHIQQQGQTALQTLEKNILKRSGAIVSFSRDLLTQIVTVGFDLVLILVLSIYLLLYGKQIGEIVRKVMPDGDGTPEDDYPVLIQHAVFGYVRGQLTFSFIMGASATVCLWIFGMLGIFPQGETYAVFFGAFYGLMEFIPYIGPIIGPAPAVLVALFNNPVSAVWVVLLFIALQQLEGHVVAPQVFRISLRINPVIIILSLLIGYQLYGIAGALLALPFAAVVRQTIVYLRRHLVLEPWAVVSPGVGVAPAGSVVADGPPGASGPAADPTTTPAPSGPAAGSTTTPAPSGPAAGSANTPGSSGPSASAVEPDRCPDCGTPAGPGDAFCRACGASLEPRVRTPG